MASSEPIADYLARLRLQLGNNSSTALMADEIESHLQDCADALRAMGHTDPETQAVARFGDPAAIATQLLLAAPPPPPNPPRRTAVFSWVGAVAGAGWILHSLGVLLSHFNGPMGGFSASEAAVLPVLALLTGAVLTRTIARTYRAPIRPYIASIGAVTTLALAAAITVTADAAVLWLTILAAFTAAAAYRNPPLPRPGIGLLDWGQRWSVPTAAAVLLAAQLFLTNEQATDPGWLLVTVIPSQACLTLFGASLLRASWPGAKRRTTAVTS